MSLRAPAAPCPWWSFAAPGALPWPLAACWAGTDTLRCALIPHKALYHLQGKLVPTSLSQAALWGLLAWFFALLWLHLMPYATVYTAEPMIGLAAF